MSILFHFLLLIARVMNNNSTLLKGKTVLITGADRGLGYFFVKEFARAGAFVLINYRVKEKNAKNLLSEIENEGGEGLLLKFDIRNNTDVQEAVSIASRQRNTIDILINNAGIISDTFFALMDETKWRSVIDTNLNGLYNCTQAVIPQMIRQKSGVILNIASIAALRSSPGQTNYAASKGGVISFTKTLSFELASKGVRVNAIVPGLIQAGITSRMNREIAEQRRKMIPMRRFGDPEEISAAALFLASDKAEYITGQTWVIDGGLSC